MIDLSLLSTPFPAEDIEWRVSRAGTGSKGIFCMVLAYVTARACQKRLDDVCGPENWCLEEPRVLDINGKSAFACGLSIHLGEGPLGPESWVTKWDVSEPTNIEPAKGGWSGAVKRAAAVWGVARYLYYLDETFAEVADTKPIINDSRWHYAKLPQDKGGEVFYWKTPNLPGWALPKERETECSKEEVHDLIREIRNKLCPENKNPADRQETITRFVNSVVGQFPVSDFTCWTRQALEACQKQIKETTDPGGVSADVPFEE